MSDLYQELILEHYKNPRNYGENREADAIVEEANASCGDVFTFYIDFTANKEGERVIKKVLFTGQGCAISTAMASMLTEELLEKTRDEVEALTREDLESLLGVEVSLLRVKCLSLAARAISKSFEN